MVSAVTDPLLLQQLNGAAPSAPLLSPVTDPLVLKQLGATPASTAGYIGTRALGGLAESGKWLGAATANEMGQYEQSQEMAALPSGQEQVNKMIYGQADVPPPNAAARYGGAVASAVGSNPVMSAIAPGYTAAGALGSEGASDLNKAYGGTAIPDWAARLAGGLVGGGVYGLGKGVASNIANPATASEKALSDVADTKAAIEQGNGMYGEFQQKANAAADSLSKIKPPDIDPAKQIVMSKTIGELTNLNVPTPEGAGQLTDLLNRTNGTLPYGSARAWLNQVGPGPLYSAMNDDLKSGIGPDAAAQLQKSNLANQAQYFLGKATTPSGFYDPQQLTKALAKTPQGDAIGALTPEMDAMTEHAGQITDLTSPWYKGAQVPPSALGQAAKKTAGAALAMSAGHLTGNPEIGALIGGYLFGHSEPNARMASLLYGINQPGVMARSTPWLTPTIAATLPGLMSPSPGN